MHAPRAAQHFPIAAMRRLREQMLERHPEAIHDAGLLRQRCIEHALRESGEDPALAAPAYDAFFAERNQVVFYDDARAALERIAAVVPVCSLSNGNADLDVIGIGHLFTARVTARSFGQGKPEVGIFHHACERLGVAPHEVLHVGDDADIDIVGAARAGLRTCWLHREDNRHVQWPERPVHPDLILNDLTALADALESPAR